MSAFSGGAPALGQARIGRAAHHGLKEGGGGCDRDRPEADAPAPGGADFFNVKVYDFSVSLDDLVHEKAPPPGRIITCGST